MFDKKPPQAPFGKEIDFLHTEGETKKKFKTVQPVELANVQPVKKAPRTSLRFSFLTRLVSFFRKKEVKSPSTKQAKSVSVVKTKSRVESPVDKKIGVLNAPKVGSAPLQFTQELHTERRGSIPVQAGQVPLVSRKDTEPIDTGKSPVESKAFGEPDLRKKALGLGEQGRSGGIKSGIDVMRKMRLSEFSKGTEPKGPTSGVPTKKLAGSKQQQIESSLEVNLLPEKKRGLSLRSKKIIILTVLSIEFLSLLLIFLVLQAKADGRMLGLRELESKGTLLEIQMKRFQEVVLDARTLQRKVTLLQNLLSTERKDFNKAFAWLEENTLKSVYLDNFVASADGSVSVHVVADNVVSAAQQMKVLFSSSEWKSVDITNLSLQDDEEGDIVVSYDVVLVPSLSFYGGGEGGKTNQ